MLQRFDLWIKTTSELKGFLAILGICAVVWAIVFRVLVWAFPNEPMDKLVCVGLFIMIGLMILAPLVIEIIKDLNEDNKDQTTPKP